MSDSLRYRVLNAVRRGLTNAPGICAKLNSKRPNVASTLRRLTDLGYIRRTSLGEYAFVKGGLGKDGRGKNQGSYGNNNGINGHTRADRAVDHSRFEKSELDKVWPAVVAINREAHLLLTGEQG